MKFTEDTILNYLDGNLSSEESRAFEEVVQRDEKLAGLLKYHKRLHTSLQRQKMTSPSDGFVERVMDSVNEINRNPSRFFNRGRMMVIGLVAIIVLSSLYYLSIHFNVGFGGIITDQVTLQKFTFDLNPAQQVLNSDLLFKLVFYVNAVIGLLLLDRAVLRPYFARRRERYSM